MITSIYDISNEFAGDLAAKLIAGSNDSEGNQDAYQVVLKLLQDSYKVSLSHYETISDVDLDEVPDKWASRKPMPNGAIQSADMQRCERTLEHDPKGGTFAGWLADRPTDFGTRTFDRTELQRWLDVKGIVSAYRFDCVKSENAASMPVVTPEPQAAPFGAVGYIQDPERRLASLREFGGSAKYARGEWTFKGIKALVAREKFACKKRRDEKTIRADLKEAAQAERDAKNAGFSDGLGQR